ncbi:PAC2 family-domain-containing protein [Pisolithus orientalis]|uniref:PAC2 family-domain-containing protein n=1 Tax=Pisolithus orientalis TaxID=936130 RepID=UPI0022247F2C|nr:PAC2 family-domain-containing protein [Pisolithus orientalis]KAI6033140.1 PAC2 family-domain-containing protein [Pisolithus orientalis]
MDFYRPITDYKLTGRVLIVPIVSVANVAQLTVDLITTTFGLQRVGVLDPKYHVPVAGAREDGAPGITMPLELFGSNSSSVAVIQQRSPVLALFKQDFTDTLLEFIRTSCVSAVIFLAGVDMSNRTDTQMLTPTTYIRPASSPAVTSVPLSSLADLPIPAYFSQSDDPRSIPFIPGGGLTRRIVSSIPTSWQIPTVCFLQYVMEGDNRYDAQILANVTAKVLNCTVSGWKQPTTWGHGLFGTPHDSTLYG